MALGMYDKLFIKTEFWLGAYIRSHAYAQNVPLPTT